MATAKMGECWLMHPQRQLANNSVAYTERPDPVVFMEEWLNLIRSGTGERGMFNRQAAIAWAMQNGRRNEDGELDNLGTNPCGEILLKPDQFCNLSEAVIRPGDSLDALRYKVHLAAILGTVQATLTKFSFLERSWRLNCERDRLLGVSLTGLRDHEILGRTSKEAYRWLADLKAQARETAMEWARILEINTPQAVTAVKPSGTVSSLVNSSSGIHPRHSPFYIRRIRVSTNDPLAKMMRDQGVPHHPEVGQTLDDMTTVVFDFPVKSPETSVFRDEVSALEQLEYWHMVKRAWCDHNPSTTIYVRQSEYVRTMNWVDEHWSMINGLTFMPFDGGVYQLAPYETVTEEEFEAAVAALPEIDFGKLSAYEKEDQTQGSREYACISGACEL
jgi:ribonucleoside-diphosphate reductase alpha chain